MTETTKTPAATTKAANAKGKAVPVVLIGGTVAVLLLGAFLLHRATSSTNQVALASQPKAATVVAPVAAHYRPERRYVGTIEPWVSARVGPQQVSAFVEAVLVRPGDRVKRGQVLATLDCRNASAVARSVKMQTKALESMQAAIAKQATRVGTLLEGGFVSTDEVDQRTADSQSKQAQVAALQAQLAGTELQQQDCVLRAPFDGEIADRQADPGAFVRPGNTVVTLVDRSVLRVTANVPEGDFAAVAPGTQAKLRVTATGEELTAAVTRRSPSADEGTRTVHLEIDLPNKDRHIPAGTTADLHIEAGEAVPALAVPLTAASVRGDTATVVVVEKGRAHKKSVPLLGERAGQLFLSPVLGDGAQVVTEGRAALSEGDEVSARVAAPPPPPQAPTAREGALDSHGARTP